MANYATLKAALDAAIYTNTQRAITGDILNAKMDEMINALGAGYQYMGMATTSTNPGTPDARVVWLASTPGTYTYFGNQVLTEGKIAFFRWDGSWHKDEVEVQPVLTMDDTPTEESDNPVKSGGIYDALETKQDTIADLSDIRSGAAAGATAYQKPSTGIPKTDLALDVQTSLGKADTAIQDVSGKEDKANKVISLSPSSNNTEYPSALCVYNLITGLTAPFTYEVAAALPTADAGTMGVFYVITDGTTSEFYITVESSGTYSWEQVGELAASITLATDGEIDALFE